MIISTKANGYTVAYAILGPLESVIGSTALNAGVEVIDPVKAPMNTKKFVFRKYDPFRENLLQW